MLLYFYYRVDAYIEPYTQKRFAAVGGVILDVPKKIV